MIKQLTKISRFASSPWVAYRSNQNFKMRTLYAKYMKHNKIVENMVLYESYHGKNATGNPYALFLEMHRNPKYKDFIHVWALNDTSGEAADLLRQFNNVRLVERETAEYTKYLAQAKYLINNTSFPIYFQKRTGQIYINTWHGTPFKTIGADVKGARISAHGNIQHNLLHVDYLVGPNEFSSKKLLESNRVAGIYNGSIVDAGYPRVDLTNDTNKEKIQNTLNLDPSKKVILFAPTWRDSDNQNSKMAAEKLFGEFQELQNKFLGEYEVLLKVHYFIYALFQEKGYEDFCVPEWIDTNELLSCVDVLITDYSSIFFDFLHSRKPVLFYTYDKEKYIEERGVYLNFDDLPGPQSNSIEELTDTIENIQTIQNQYRVQYEKMIDLYCYNDDGKAASRVLEIVMEGVVNRYVKTDNTNDKRKLLIWGGGMTRNGITMSLINLLNNINHDKYDISLIFASKLTEDTLASLLKVNPKVRIIYRVGTLNYSIKEFYQHRMVMHFGLGKNRIKKIVPRSLYQKEFNRVFGQTKFDVCIDYCGYTPFWTLMLAYSDIEKKNLYMHSDMVADSKKIINGRKKHKNNFDVIFPLYERFDKLLGVSKEATEINRNQLRQYGVAKKIFNVNNVLDYTNILEKSKEIEIEEITDTKYLLLNKNSLDGVMDIKAIEVPSKKDINFIAIGRLSPEKDHEKLIRAFHRLNGIFPNTKLYIVGDGVLKTKLRLLIENLSLAGKVILTGNLDNPYALLKLADCFVMSSNYEGQGLVVLEALTLNKPVISTDIPGPRGILEKGYGELVDNTESGLFTGMTKYMLEKFAYKKYDIKSYDEAAIQSFYKLVLDEKHLD